MNSHWYFVLKSSFESIEETQHFSVNPFISSLVRPPLNDVHFYFWFPTLTPFHAIDFLQGHLRRTYDLVLSKAPIFAPLRLITSPKQFDRLCRSSNLTSFSKKVSEAQEIFFCEIVTSRRYIGWMDLIPIRHTRSFLCFIFSL